MKLCTCNKSVKKLPSSCSVIKMNNKKKNKRTQEMLPLTKLSTLVTRYDWIVSSFLTGCSIFSTLCHIWAALRKSPFFSTLKTYKNAKCYFKIDQFQRATAIWFWGVSWKKCENWNECLKNILPIVNGNDN